VSKSSPSHKFWRAEDITSAIWKSAANRTARSKQMAAKLFARKTFSRRGQIHCRSCPPKRWLSGTSSGSRYQAEDTLRPVYSEIAGSVGFAVGTALYHIRGRALCAADDAQSNFRMARETLFVPRGA